MSAHFLGDLSYQGLSTLIHLSVLAGVSMYVSPQGPHKMSSDVVTINYGIDAQSTSQVDGGGGSNELAQGKTPRGEESFAITEPPLSEKSDLQDNKLKESKNEVKEVILTKSKKDNNKSNKNQSKGIATALPQKKEQQLVEEAHLSNNDDHPVAVVALNDHKELVTTESDNHDSSTPVLNKEISEEINEQIKKDEIKSEMSEAPVIIDKKSESTQVPVDQTLVESKDETLDLSKSEDPNISSLEEEKQGTGLVGMPSSSTEAGFSQNNNGMRGSTALGLKEKNHQKPKYDVRDRLANREGMVILRYSVLEDGTVKNIRVLKSSGHRSLDYKSYKALKETLYYPGQGGEAQKTYVWSLSGGAQELPGKLRSHIR